MNIWSFIDHIFSPCCLLCGARALAAINLCRECERDLPRPPPARCPVCAVPVSAGTMCGRCLIRPPAYSSTVAALRYEGLAAQLLRRFKFDRDLAAGACLGGLLLARTAGAARPELLVPVPMTPRRLRERGFNQAHELARTVGRRLRIPVDAASARRVTQAMPQSRLPSRRQRRRNVAGVFHVEPRRVDGYHVAVIDDVMTSGATVSALALSLRRGGASRVDVWVACRAGLES